MLRQFSRDPSKLISWFIDWDLTHNQKRILHKGFENGHNLGRNRSVDHTVIEAGGGGHDCGERYLSFHFPWLFDPCTNAEDECLRRIDNGEHFVDAKHPEIGDRGRSAFIITRFQLAVARFCSKRFALLCNG